MLYGPSSYNALALLISMLIAVARRANSMFLDRVNGVYLSSTLAPLYTDFDACMCVHLCRFNLLKLKPLYEIEHVSVVEANHR